MSRQPPFLEGLFPALERLDHLLARAITAALAAFGPDTMDDRYRGLYIDHRDVEQLLARKPGAPPWQIHVDSSDGILTELADSNSPFSWLRQAFELTPFDIDLLLIALGADIDLRYERLYAYLQDDVTRRRPSVDLALNLLCESAEAKLARRGHFASSAPLIRHGLLHLTPDPNQAQPPLLAHYLKMDDQIVHWLTGQTSLDARLVPFCQLVTATVPLDSLALDPELKRVLPTLVRRASEADQPLRMYFHGSPGAEQRRTAEALAGAIRAPLLTVDLVRALSPDVDLERLLPVVFREAWFQDALLYIEPVDALDSHERSALYRSLLAAMANHVGIVILGGRHGRLPARDDLVGVIAVPFSMPGFAERRAYWQSRLATAGVALRTDELNALADRFRLTPEQIADAVATAGNRVRWREARAPQEFRTQTAPAPILADLFSAARAQSSEGLMGLARQIEPKHAWRDIVLPENTLAQLRELCNQVAHRHRVLDEWGFDRKLSLGTGTSVLFAGPPGTGKTTAAEIIARELELDLYGIDLSSVVSKYIGETEKNLERIFTAAENANAILFFDEADALFGKRSEVRDSHDRYANIEIAYLLQKMEQYTGIAILATNLRQNLDEAFVRRLQFIVEFPFPDEADRRRIWQIHFPREAPREETIDYASLARQFRITGGSIKNIVLGAAFLAAASSEVIGMRHLLQATQREYQKMGKLLSAEDLEVHAHKAVV